MVSRSLFGIEILHSVVQHLDSLLPRINQCVLFRASTSCKMEVKEDLDTEKKTQKSRYPKKDISIPTKRVTPTTKVLPCPSLFLSANILCTLFASVPRIWGSIVLVAHPCGDPNRATQCRAQSVAPNSRRIGDVAPKSRYTPGNQGFAPFSGPPCRTFLSFPAERGRGGLVEGIRLLSRHFWVPKTDRATGGYRSYSHTSRASLSN